MSHVRANEIPITDLDCARAAAGKFNALTWQENQKTHEWFGKWVKDYHGSDAAYKRGIDPTQYGTCEHAIKVADCQYEIGVVKRTDGNGYSLVWDFYGPGRMIEDIIGKNAEKFMVEYQKEFIARHCMAEGYMATMQDVVIDGEEKVRIEMTPYQ